MSPVLASFLNRAFHIRRRYRVPIIFPEDSIIRSNSVEVRTRSVRFPRIERENNHRDLIKALFTFKLSCRSCPPSFPSFRAGGE